MPDRAPLTDEATRSLKDAVNLALDQVESAGHEFAEVVGYGELTERLGNILGELEQWKADAWGALDA